MTTEDPRKNSEIISEARKVAKLYRGVGHKYGVEKNLDLLADRLEAAEKELAQIKALPFVGINFDAGTTLALTGENAGHWVEGSPTHLSVEVTKKELEESTGVLNVLRRQRDVAESAITEANRMLGSMPILYAGAGEVTLSISELTRVREYLDSVTDNRVPYAVGTTRMFEVRQEGKLVSISDQYVYPDPDKNITIESREYRPVTPHFIGEYPTTIISPSVEPPHSRACGFKKHAHGTDCSTNCPSCHGVPV